MENSSNHSGSGDNITGDKVIHNNQRTIYAENYYENYNVTNIYHKRDSNISIPDIYNASIVSIYNGDNEVIGSGFLITSNYIITTYENIANFETLNVTFALREPQLQFKAKVVETNSIHNIALLEIESEEPFNIPLVTTADYGQEFVACGFDSQINDWIEGSYKGNLSKSKKQITIDKKSIIANSFSGTPLWDISSGGISGVMIDAQSMIPIQKVVEYFKPLQEALRSENSNILSKEIFKDKVWISSVESADKLQFSVLALVETVLAVSISFYVWFTYDFYWHIIIGLIVAPLFLLRTEKSDNYGLALFEKYHLSTALILGLTVFLILIIIDIITNTDFYYLFCEIFFPKNSLPQDYLLKEYLPIWYNNLYILTPTEMIEKQKNNYNFFCIILVSFLLAFHLPIWILKSFTTIKSFSLRSINKIPNNWYKITFSTDIFHPIELMPSISKTNSKYKTSKFINKSINTLVRESNGELEIIVKLIDIITLFLFLFAVFIPVILFRYSIKSTAWIYLPLLWLIIPSEKADLTEKMKKKTTLPQNYLMFVYSLIIVFICTFLPLFFPQLLEGFELPSTFKTIFFAYPDNFGIWHITNFLFAMITILFMISFSHILIYRKKYSNYGDKWGAKIYSLKKVQFYSALITLFFTAYHILAMIPDGFFVELFRNMKIVPS